MGILKPPCTYQGCKQRVAKELVNYILSEYDYDSNTKFYDLCCGSGAVTLELMNQGIQPSQIVMVDISSWGTFWSTIGNETFSYDKFLEFSNKIPRDKSKVQAYLQELSKTDALVEEPYVYLLLQAGAFGGKQIWRVGNSWKNTTFRSYWQPTETSSRRSPVNPMMPSINELELRVKNIVNSCNGLTCYNTDVTEILGLDISANSIIYIDPPYKEITGYGFKLDIDDFLKKLQKKVNCPILMSERNKVVENAIQLGFSGTKGGMNGKRKKSNEEWLNIIQC